MAVIKMKLMNIAGPISRFEEVILSHVINNDVHLEDAQMVLESINGLFPYMEENQYEQITYDFERENKRFNCKIKQLSKSKISEILKNDNRKEELVQYIGNISKKTSDHEQAMKNYKNLINEKSQVLNQMMPIMDLDINIEELFNLDYIKFRFGKMSTDNYRKLKRYIRELNVLLITNQISEDVVWLSYFMPAIISEKIDSIFASLFFERVRLTEGISGKPLEAKNTLQQEISKLEQLMKDERESFDKFIIDEKERFAKNYIKVIYLHKANEIKTYAAHTLESFYIVGWVPERKANEIKRALARDHELMYIEEDADDAKYTTPPTKLKNTRFATPYEMLITMYGLPAYNTIDPTSFVAITYTIMFGIMFGDVGQGAIFLLAGLFLALVKKKAVGLIAVNIGVMSIIFGFLYGSIFGNEEILTPIWASPLHEINTMLYLSVGLGVFLIIVAMIMNIINRIKTKDYGQLWFSKNGIAGFLVYIGAIIVVLNFIISGNLGASLFMIIIFFVLPMIAIFFEKQLSRLISNNKEEHKEKSSFVEAFFELFEAILGFLSNTISFVRIGAFALNHAGLSLAVWTLYNMTASAGGKVIVLILGNLLIIGLEGLIVGIQCLRLQYYEMFSRFFSGNGREFVSQDIGKDN
ncbi:MAG: V-type ATP synthase subunit I [Clostridiales bacterium]|nr:V-type ATP synthase subunit I [Clostridiales bacterium]